MDEEQDTTSYGFGPILDSLPSPFATRAAIITPLMQAYDADKTTDQSDLEPYFSTLRELPSPTFGHYLTTINRIYAEDLEHDGRLAVTRFTPIFVIGVLELPGTLGFVLGYSSGLDIGRFMKPGICLCVVRGKHMQGTIVFGRGKLNRDALDEWYGDSYSAVEIQVAIELADGAVRRLRALRWVEGEPQDRVNGLEQEANEAGGWKEMRSRLQSRNIKSSERGRALAPRALHDERGGINGVERRDDIGD